MTPPVPPADGGDLLSHFVCANRRAAFEFPFWPSIEHLATHPSWKVDKPRRVPYAAGHARFRFARYPVASAQAGLAACHMPVGMPGAVGGVQHMQADDGLNSRPRVGAVQELRRIPCPS